MKEENRTSHCATQCNSSGGGVGRGIMIWIGAWYKKWGLKNQTHERRTAVDIRTNGTRTTRSAAVKDSVIWLVPEVRGYL